MNQLKSDTLPKAFAKNLSELVIQKRKHDAKVPTHLKFLNPMIRFLGSIWFLGFNLILFVVWFGVNEGAVSFVKVFDPYPFDFLTLTVSLEAVMLSIIVLIGQRRMQNDSDERSVLDLHINLLAESETTLLLKKLARIERHLGIEVDESEDQQLADLIKETQPDRLAEVIHDLFEKKNKNVKEKSIETPLR